MTFKPGDRVRFVPRSSWSFNYRELRGQMATVRDGRRHEYLDIVWDIPSPKFCNGSYYFEGFELSAPLTPFEQRVHDYIQRELR